MTLDLCEDDQQVLLNALVRNELDVVLTYDLNIDEEGRIEEVIEKVKVADHAAQIVK